jgi:hypothetical protein
MLTSLLMSSSLPGLTRQSIIFAIAFYEAGWMRGHQGVTPVFNGLCPRMTGEKWTAAA